MSENQEQEQEQENTVEAAGFEDLALDLGANFNIGGGEVEWDE
ncbi:hypothetical protein [Streptomyces sp. NPDC059957]